MREHYRADINLFYRGMQFQPRRFIRVTGVSQMWGGGAVGSIFKFARDRKVDFTGPVYLYTRQANAHTQYGQIPVYARQRVAVGVVARVFANFIGNRGMQGTCTRSSLPGELEFLAADRILLRESCDAHDTQDGVWVSGSKSLCARARLFG